jgi:carbohydrate-selective porin OprB
VSLRETVLELAYRARIAGWLMLQPDLQFFFDPHYSRRDAVAFGVRATFVL